MKNKTTTYKSNEIIGYATFVKPFIKTSLSMYTNHNFETNQTVTIAAICCHNAGFSYRIYGTCLWVPEEYLNIDSNLTNLKTQLHYKPGENMEERLASTRKMNSVYASKKYVSKEILEQLKDYTPTKHSKKPPTKEKIKEIKKPNLEDASSKGLLRSLFAQFKPGQNVTINFSGDLQNRSGAFTVKRSYTGRGKGGSQMVDLTDTNGNNITTGSPQSDKIVSIIYDNKQYTFKSNNTDNTNVNKNNANNLYNIFEKLLGTNFKIKVVSNDLQFNGNFTIVQSEKCRGRAKQIKLSLENTNKQIIELYSYRHSGVIVSVEII